MTAVDVATAVLRVWLGVVMLAHGLHHARDLDGTASWFRSIGFRAPTLQARLSAAGELAIGAGLVVGLLTGPALAGLVATMTVAFRAVHRAAGFFVFHRPDEGYEYVATLVVVATGLAVLGPGAASLDAVIGLDVALDGWSGAALVVAGIAAGAAQLLASWRPTGSG